MSRKPNLAMRETIVCAARDLIYKNGFKGVSMDDVARAAGVKKANLFHYYPTKEALGLAVFDTTLSRQQINVHNMLADVNSDPLHTVQTMFDDAANGMEKSGCCGGCFAGNLAQELSDYNEAMRQRIAEHMQEWRRHWAVYLENHRVHGYFRSDFDAPRAASGILSLFEGAMLLSKANKTVDALRDAKQVALRHLESYRAQLISN